MRHSTSRTGPCEIIAPDELPDDALELAMSYLRWLRLVGRPWYFRGGGTEYSTVLHLKACGLVTLTMDDEFPSCFRVDLVRRSMR